MLTLLHSMEADFSRIDMAYFASEVYLGTVGDCAAKVGRVVNEG